MNRIDKCFEELKAAGKKALITFITAGDPDLESNSPVIRPPAMVKTRLLIFNTSGNSEEIRIMELPASTAFFINI